MVSPESTAFKHASIALSEIFAAGCRLEASVFNLEAMQARELIKDCGWPIVPLLDPQLLKSASYPGRFKRKYVGRKHGLPFILPSQITEINPSPSKWITGLSAGSIKELSVNKRDVLLTRSGTIGQCSIAGTNLAGKIMSDDLIRLVPNEEYCGYLYAFLVSKTGQLLLTTSNYGAVVQHIEPAHLGEIYLPVASKEIREEINELILSSFDLRDESNALILQAQETLIHAVGLPAIDEIEIKEYQSKVGVINCSQPLSMLQGRFDGSFHHPLAEAIEASLHKLAPNVTTIGDGAISSEVILPGRFKRIYVEEGFGVPFIGGKEIGSLDPRTEKNLSLQGHGERIKEQLTIHQNQVMVTCSGTIGKTNIAPKHWEGWTSSQHVIRITAASPIMAGYLYAWLSTDYGRTLVRRFTYGSVVDEVEDRHMKNVAVPLLGQPLIEKIGNLVLKANEKRYEAFIQEQQALSLFNQKVLGIVEDTVVTPTELESLAA
jgi:type I restriction enzyme S subunit